MVYKAYQYPDFGFYPENAQHINAPYAAHNTSVTARGVNIPNNSFFYPLSTGATFSPDNTYGQWCSNLAAAGTNMIRIIWGGRQSIANPNIYDLEPPPHGTYNIWHTALDDSGSLATYRSSQVSGSPGDPSFPLAYWNASNIKELLDACTNHGIEVIIELSHNNEFDGWWPYHAWNAENRYLDRVNATTGVHIVCEPADRGFLADKRLVYSDPDALQAMKDRISFVINLVGGYECVCMWGICSEGNWNVLPDFWGEPSFNSTVIANVRNYMVPWYAAVATHIRNEDVYNRPIMSSVAHSPAANDYVWPTNADDPRNVRMEPLMAYPIDIVGTNCYQGNYENSVKHLNAVRTKVHPKQVLIHQYYPAIWTIGTTAPLRIEDDPYLDSRRMEWLGMALKWSTGPGRWMGLEEKVHNNWIRGGYADPDYYSIGAVTETFRAANNWKTWTAGAADWSANTSSVGLDYSVTTGTANQFVGVLVWTSGGAKTLTIDGVTDGAWTFKIYDWTDGTLDATVTPVTAGNSVDVAVTPTTYNQAFVFGTKD